MNNVLNMEESEFMQLTHIEEQYNQLNLMNQTGEPVDADALTDHLQKLEGIDRVTDLTIDWNSSLTDLRVLRAFTNLTTLSIYNKKLNSLDGIKWFNKGDYLKICTTKNRRRSLSQLSEAKVTRMDLYVEREDDFSAVTGCKDLESIDIFHLRIDPELSEWRDVPLKYIAFKSCKFKHLGNTAEIERLNKINVLGCRNLEQFTGDNSNITRVIVEDSKKLDLRTLKTFTNIEILVVNGCTQPMNLSEIGGLQHVKDINFLRCHVDVDLINLKTLFPKIESLYISGMKKEYGLQLKQLNPDVRIASYTFELK